MKKAGKTLIIISVVVICLGLLFVVGITFMWNNHFGSKEKAEYKSPDENYIIEIEQSDAQGSFGSSDVKITVRNMKSKEKEILRRSISDDGGMGKIEFEWIDSKNAQVVLSGSEMRSQTIKIEFGEKFTITQKEGKQGDLLFDMGVLSANDITEIRFSDDSLNEITINDENDIAFLSQYTYVSDFSSDRMHELFLFPNTKQITIVANGEETVVCLLSDGTIVCQPNKGTWHESKIYNNCLMTMNREKLKVLIEKYNGYFDDSVN